MSTPTKVTIEKIIVRTKKKDGSLLLTKRGNPYFNVSIQSGGDWVSGFMFDKPTWKEGDEVELIITQNGQYKNFEVPKRSSNSMGPVMAKLEAIHAILLEMRSQSKFGVKEIDLDLEPDKEVPF